MNIQFDIPAGAAADRDAVARRFREAAEPFHGASGWLQIRESFGVFRAEARFEFRGIRAVGRGRFADAEGAASMALEDLIKRIDARREWLSARNPVFAPGRVVAARLEYPAFAHVRTERPLPAMSGAEALVAWELSGDAVFCYIDSGTRKLCMIGRAEDGRFEQIETP